MDMAATAEVMEDTEVDLDTIVSLFDLFVEIFFYKTNLFFFLDHGHHGHHGYGGHGHHRKLLFFNLNCHQSFKLISLFL